MSDPLASLLWYYYYYYYCQIINLDNIGGMLTVGKPIGQAYFIFWFTDPMTLKIMK